MSISTGQIIAATGVTARQFNMWVTKGYVKAEGLNRPGSGKHRQFPVKTIQKVRHMLRLIDMGFRPAVAAEIADNAKFQGANTWRYDSSGFDLQWIMA